MKKRILNLLIALDQFLFCLVTLGASDPDETLSAAAWRWDTMGHPMGWLRPVIDRLFWLQPDHCMNAYLAERHRRQLPAAYR